MDGLVELALSTKDLANGVVNILPAFAVVPRTLTHVPGTASIRTIGHVVVSVREARVPLKDSRREVRLDRLQGRREHLKVRDLSRHQEAKTLLDIRVVRKLEKILIHDLSPGLRGNVGTKIHG